MHSSSVITVLSLVLPLGSLGESNGIWGWKNIGEGGYDASYCTRDNKQFCKSGWATVGEFQQDMEMFPERFLNGTNYTLWEDINPEFKGQNTIFNCLYATELTGHLWALPATAVIIYILMMVFLPGYVKRQVEARGLVKGRLWDAWIKPSIIRWNALLALFSMVGACVTIPHLVGTLYMEGLRPTVCWHSAWFGNGYAGMFTAFFIYSKLFELLDTFFLIAKQRPVIFLHYYHHISVLLYCWHSYSVRVSHGLWFAAMNYFVHSVMYSYYWLMCVADKPTRDRVRKSGVDRVITLLQLAQMVVGVLVTLKAGNYGSEADAKLPCNVDRSNNFMASVMYGSYFLLFLELFVTRYLCKKVQESCSKDKKVKRN